MTFDEARKDANRRLKSGALTVKEHGQLLRTIDRQQLKMLDNAAKDAIRELAEFKEKLERSKVREAMRRKWSRAVKHYEEAEA